jgi:ABC-type sugar transport system permease subunit/ABC-type glycerol-3-phosphate transport system substrate-binding protein
MPLLLAFLSLFFPAQLNAQPVPAGRIPVIYWEKWTGFEMDGMQAIVDDFNNSQNRIWVKYVSISGIDQKTLIATAGGQPPDIAGLWDGDMVDFADKNALTPLDGYCKKAGLGPEHYIPIYWDLCAFDGHVWGLPSTPATTALHWNKDLFAQAGLDPERPPHTIAELDEFSKKLTVRDADGRIQRMGFLPPEPGWWHWGWGPLFGGKLWDGGSSILMDSPENVEAFTWIQSYAKTYGTGALQVFQSSFGNWSSPQSAFMAGQVAMVVQGVWLAKYLSEYAPRLRWGAAPFPVAHEGDKPVTFAESDMLVVPRGAKHPDEAFEFIAYVNRQPVMEKLCVAHQKNSPLREVSADFYARHQNPSIRLFQDLAWSPQAQHVPKMSVWHEYAAEIQNAFDRVWLIQATPAQAMKDLQVHMQKSWDRELEKRRRAASSPPEPWLNAVPFLLVALVFLGLALGTAWGEWRRLKATGARGPALRRRLKTGLMFASPWLIGLAVFVLYPIAASVVYSFCDYSVLTEPRWIGLGNFRDLLSDEVFLQAFRNTLVYAALALPCGLTLAFGLALLLDSKVRGTGLYRTFFFLPSVTPLVASAMIWLWIFNSQYGILNYILNKVSFGLIPAIPWLSDSRYALPALVMMGFWGVGYTVVILLAALQDVPVSLYEAAELDGAGWWRKVWHITLPLISPVLYFNAIMGVIGAVQVFAEPFIMTGGGPARSTLFYIMWLYTNAFGFLRMGYASAMAWILFLLILGLTGIAVWIGKKHVYYVGG